MCEPNSSDPLNDAAMGKAEKKLGRRPSEEMVPKVYAELRRLAAGQIRQRSVSDTFQATELVHEAFLRLVDAPNRQSWDSKGHFYVAAAEAMRRILVERARSKGRLKRGGDRDRVPLFDIGIENGQDPVNLLALDDALGRFAVEYPQHAQLVQLRYFAGLTLEESAEVMEVSRATASRYWTFARAWLFDAVEGKADASNDS